MLPPRLAASSHPGHMNTDDARSARCERISRFRAGPSHGIGRSAAPRSIEAIRVAPAAAPPRPCGGERPPLPADPDLQLDELALLGDAAGPDRPRNRTMSPLATWWRSGRSSSSRRTFKITNLVTPRICAAPVYRMRMVRLGPGGPGMRTARSSRSSRSRSGEAGHCNRGSGCRLGRPRPAAGCLRGSSADRERARAARIRA